MTRSEKVRQLALRDFLVIRKKCFQILCYCGNSMLFLVSFGIYVQEHRHACMYMAHVHYYCFRQLVVIIVLRFYRFPLKPMQAFSLDFNLRSHMKTHSQENYHICPYPECGKRYAHEYKLKNHIASSHQKVCNFSTALVLTMKY